MRFPLAILLVCSLVVAGLAMPLPAQAQAAAPGTIYVPAAGTDCSKYVGVTNRVAGCVRETMGNVTTRFFNTSTGFYPMLAKAIAAFLTLAVAIYGVMVATGMVEKVGRDTLMFITRMALVGFFTQSTPLIYSTIITAMDSVAATVVQVTPKNGTADGMNDFGKIKCLQNMKAAAQEAGKPVVGPWIAMDCIIDTVIGIKIPTSTTGTISTLGINKAYNDTISGTGVSRGLIFFFFSGMKTSVIGLILGVVGFIFMWGILSMIIKALMIYIGGYIGVTFMVIISPLFIPLVMFQPTKQYFDKWVKLTISFALQPVLTLLFVSLSITAVDLALSSGDYSVMYRIAGNASRQPNFNINKYLTEHQAIVKAPATLFNQKTNVAKEIKTTLTTTKGIAPISRSLECIGNASATGTGNACPETIPVKLYRDTIDWKALAAARTPHVVREADAQNDEQQISREVLAACIFLGVVVFVMNKLLTVVPHVLVDLIGDLGQTPNLNSAMTGGWNRAAAGLSQKVEGGAQDAINSLANQVRKSP